MAKNMIHKYTKTEVWPVPSGTVSGAAVTSSTGQPGVALTSRGDATKSQIIGPYTVSGIGAGGVGLLANETTVAIDGAFKFDVVGMVASTPKNTIVYSVGAAGAAVTSLTLTAGSNIPFGKVDRLIGEKSSTETSVWVGRFVDAT